MLAPEVDAFCRKALRSPAATCDQTRFDSKSYLRRSRRRHRSTTNLRCQSRRILLREWSRNVINFQYDDASNGSGTFNCIQDRFIDVADPFIGRVGMRADHIRVFRKAASKFGCTIVVREQNPLSAQYMGRSGFKPKPIWCHAKTAGNTNGPEALRGLVVDPTSCPDAFEGGKLDVAINTWRKFADEILSHRLGFKLNDSVGDPHFGCLLFHGDYLYSDYDLKSVTPFHGQSVVFKEKYVKNKPSLVEGLNHPKAPKNYTTEIEQNIATFFKDRTGIALIQHGAAVNDPKDTGVPELCDVFLPVSPFHLREVRNK